MNHMVFEDTQSELLSFNVNTMNAPINSRAHTIIWSATVEDEFGNEFVIDGGEDEYRNPIPLVLGNTLIL